MRDIKTFYLIAATLSMDSACCVAHSKCNDNFKRIKLTKKQKTAKMV